MVFLLACVDDPPESAATPDSADADTDADSDADSDTDSDTDTDTDTDTTFPVDADGDGSPATEDCDDNDASVYPGAFDQCDTVDQDCDGEPFGLGACGDASVMEAGVDWVLTTSYVEVKGVRMTGDHTGDGVPDLLVTNSYYHAVFPGGALPEAPLLMVDEAWSAIDGSRYYGEWGTARYDAGDVDGDGILDLGMLVTDDEPGMHLFWGPFAEGEVRAADAADVYIEAVTVYDDLWGVTAVGPLDLDGDGRADAVVNGYFDGSDSYDVFLGASHVCTAAGGGGGTRTPRALGDLDGDGLDEVQVHGTEQVVVRGPDLVENCSAPLADLALFTIPFGLVSNIGDWSGDGVPDLVSGDSTSDTIADNAGEIYFFSGASFGELSADTALGSWVGVARDDRLGGNLTPLDFDGDGVRDLLTSDVGGAYSVIRVGTLPALREDLPQRRLRFDYPSTFMGDFMTGDFDADGFEDIFIQSDTDVGPPFNLGVYRGFEVPWDDSAYW